MMMWKRSIVSEKKGQRQNAAARLLGAEDKKQGKIFQNALFIAPVLMLFIMMNGCTPTTTGAVKQDTTLSGEGKKLEFEGAKYSGPEYTIGIITFKNKTRTPGLETPAADTLATLIKSAGLDPIMLTQEAMQEQEEMIKLQQTGAVKTGKKSATEGYDSIDFRVEGSITAYSEVEEGSDILVAQSKTQVARVQVDYGLVDIATGKRLLQKSGMGEYKKKTGGVLGFGSKSSADVGLRDGALRDAFTKAMSEMIKELNNRPFQSKVLLVDGKSIIFRGGEKSNLSAGTKLGVYRPGEDLVDPDTGRVIGKREKQIGEIMFTSHQNDKVSEGTVSSGMGFQKGDIVRVVK